MEKKPAKPDVAVAALAARQHGIVTRRQLAAVGLGDSMVSRRVANGRLHRVHRGVYAVGHAALSRPGGWMAAVLACGEGAALSHRSAAVLWGLLRPAAGPIHVSLPSSSGRERRTGIRIHRCASLIADEVTRRLGIPVTTPARTIVDLRGAIPENQLRRAIREAEVRGMRTGVRVAEPTRSELEHLFLRLCRLHRLPRPEVNVRIEGWEVDFLWRDRDLVVETDGYRYHRGAVAFETDHARDLALRALGLNVLRFTHRQVTAEPAVVVAAIRHEFGVVRR